MSKDVGKDRILALIEEGRARREEGKLPPSPAPTPIAATPPPPPKPGPDPLPIIEIAQEEPPPESPNELTPDSGLKPPTPRRKRVGLRSDPEWIQKTIYLRKATVSEATKVADAMGVDFSELVEWALSYQVMGETRSPDLAAILEQMKR
jgi:hypothetical protein